MSRRGNCWDNALRESFFDRKDEIDYKNCTAFEDLQKTIDDYIRYYNNYRAMEFKTADFCSIQKSAVSCLVLFFILSLT